MNDITIELHLSKTEAMMYEAFAKAYGYPSVESLIKRLLDNEIAGHAEANNC